VRSRDDLWWDGIITGLVLAFIIWIFYVTPEGSEVTIQELRAQINDCYAQDLRAVMHIDGTIECREFKK